jgi:hypothetical protein
MKMKLLSKADDALRARFGTFPGFVVEKVPGVWQEGRYPDVVKPNEFGAYLRRSLRCRRWPSRYHAARFSFARVGEGF